MRLLKFVADLRGCKRFFVTIGVGVCIGAAYSFIPDVARAQTDEVLPELTSQGAQWAKKIIKNALAVQQGKALNRPPYVDADTANSLSVIAGALKEVAKTDDPDSLPSDGDYVALNETLEAEVAAGRVAGFEDTATLIDLLNTLPETFPPTLPPFMARSASCGGGGGLNFQTLARVFGGLVPKGKVGEKRSEGQLFTFVPTHQQQIAEIDFINGVQTSLGDALDATNHLQRQLDRDIGHIHNRAGFKIGDYLQTLLQYKKLSKDQAVKTLRARIFEHAESCKPYLILAHSQGADIATQAVQEALSLAIQNGDTALQQKIIKSIGVLTMGGFVTSSSFPANFTQKELVERSDDSIPQLARGINFTQPPSAIKGLVGGVANLLNLKEHSLKDSYVPDPCPGNGTCDGGICSGGPLDGCACNMGSRAEVQTKLAALEERFVTDCGNGNVELCEDCDDGNRVAGDGCDATCHWECGNGRVDSNEQCDGAATGTPCPGHCIPPGQQNQCQCSRYMIDLGTLGGSYSDAGAINDAGQVVGYSSIAGEGNTPQHAFLYSGGVMSDLGTLGGSWSVAADINNAGQVAGTADAGSNIFGHAFLYSGGVMTDLGTDGGIGSGASGINNTGQVVGSLIAAGTSYYQAVLYGGVITYLGTLGGFMSFATDINDVGQVVGYSSIAGEGNTPQHAFLYSGGVMTDLGTLGGTYSFAHGINNAGQIVGTSSIAGDIASHAFLYSGGVMTDLGTLGGTQSDAFAVNDVGQVVGYSSIAGEGNTPQHAFLYSGGVMTDLGTLGGSYSLATAINAAGQVTGYADTAGNAGRHAFLY